MHRALAVSDLRRGPRVRRLAFGACFVAICALAVDTADARGRRRRCVPCTTPGFAQKTAYLIEPLDVTLAGGEQRIVRRISVEGVPGGKGKLMLDGNKCILNEFGDVKDCTEVFYEPFCVTFPQLKIPDPTCHNRRLLAIADSPMENVTFRVAVPRPGDSLPARLLVLDSKTNELLRLITLEPYRAP